MGLTTIKARNFGTDVISRLFYSSPNIGLDLAREKLNMVQIDTRFNQFRVLSAISDYHNSSYEEILQQPEKFREIMKYSFRKGSFSGRNVVSTVPQSLLTNLFLNFQCRPQESETQAILSSLKNRVSDDLGNYVIDYLAIKPQQTEQTERTALVSMVKQDDIEIYLDLLVSCGLSVQALEVGPVAIKRLITIMAQQVGKEKVLAINFGTKNSYLTVIWQDQLLLDRKIDFGMNDVLEAIAKAFDVNTKTALNVLHQYGLNQTKPISFMADIDEDDASSIQNVLADVLMPGFYSLADAIKDVLVYVASETRGGAIELIYLMGSLARVSAVDEVISSLISIPVKTINPFYGFSDDIQLSESAADLGPLAGIAVATGLSLRGCI